METKEKKLVFEQCEINDLVKFKKEKEDGGFAIYRGIIKEIKDNKLAIVLDNSTKIQELPKGLNIWIDRRSVLQIFPHKLLHRITPRLALKLLWKKLIFREVKTVKATNVKKACYHYLNRNGFPRIKTFKTKEEAYESVKEIYHKNISVHYYDYFGFTTNKYYRENDIYYDKEIFFSKKCYTELNFTNKPTGYFGENRGEKEWPPYPGQMICGLVEKGEKGLFYRKWFICSKEFMTLWTMICEPKDPSLLEEDNKWSLSVIYKKKKTKKKRVKTLDTLLKELDTSKYQIDYNEENIRLRRKKYIIQNLEKSAIYLTDIYTKLAKMLFKNGFHSYSYSFSYDNCDIEEYEIDPFKRRFVKNLLWMLRVT